MRENNKLNKKVKHLEKCVTELNKRNHDAVTHINTLESKFDDLLNLLRNSNNDKKNVKEANTIPNDDKPYEANKETFPPLMKSFSTKVSKPKGNIVQSDPTLFTNPNMNEARVVSSKRKRQPNYHEMLEKNIEEETSKMDKTKLKLKNNNTITMDRKDDLREALMHDMNELSE